MQNSILFFFCVGLRSYCSKMYVFFQSLRAVGTIFNSSHEDDEMHPALRFKGCCALANSMATDRVFVAVLKISQAASGVLITVFFHGLAECSAVLGRRRSVGEMRGRLCFQCSIYV